MKTRRIAMNIIIPLFVMLVLFTFFSIYSQGKTVSGINLLNIIDQAMLTIFTGLGAIFVIALGGVDLSVGTTLALSAVLAGTVYTATGTNVYFIPIVLGICLICGLLNGFLVTVCKIPSFMATISMLIGVRGLINYIIDKWGVSYASLTIMQLNAHIIKLPILILCILAAIYLMEYNKFGRYCKAIGENEMTAVSLGLPVKKVKIIAFVISSFMAVITGIFMTAKLGGTNYTMGSNFEMQVVMSMFLGGVLVTGGNSAKIPKLLIGALTFAVVENGLVLCNWTSSDIKQIIEGLVLMLVLFISIRFDNKYLEIGRRRKIDPTGLQENSQ